MNFYNVFYEIFEWTIKHFVAIMNKKLRMIAKIVYHAILINQIFEYVVDQVLLTIAIKIALIHVIVFDTFSNIFATIFAIFSFASSKKIAIFFLIHCSLQNRCIERIRDRFLKLSNKRQYLIFESKFSRFWRSTKNEIASKKKIYLCQHFRNFITNLKIRFIVLQRHKSKFSIFIFFRWKRSNILKFQIWFIDVNFKIIEIHNDIYVIQILMNFFRV